jgi:hypothetical protein
MVLVHGVAVARSVTHFYTTLIHGLDFSVPGFAESQN